jgi:cytochrome b561
MSETKKYPKLMIILHWATVILVALEIYKGITMEDFEFNETNFHLYKSHALLGVIIMILTIIRFFVKRKNINNLPNEIEYYSAGHKTLVNTALNLIYFLLITTPIVGFVMVYQTGTMGYCSGGDFPVDVHFNETLESIHKFMFISLAALIVMHVGGVFMYIIKTKDNILKRMCMLIK